MKKMQIVKEPDTVLRKPAKPVVQVTKAIRKLVKDMKEAMHEAEGVGLAAPQIGESLQIFVASATREPGTELVAINPSLEILDSTPNAIQEGCLSLPRIWSLVNRSSRVRLTALDERGKPFTLDAGGLLAIILQHEYDHLQGTLFVDRLPEWQRKRLMDKFYNRP